jgi:hypothetical protein
MPLILPNEGLPDWLDWMVRHTGGDPPNLTLFLWVNDVTPTQAIVFADLTFATFGGAAPWVITRSGWTAPVMSGPDAVSTWGTTPITWNATTGGQTVYGYAIYNPVTVKLMIVERFDTPRPVSPGDVVSLLPRVELTTLPP